MAWVRPRRSRPGQEGADAGNSGGIGGSSLPGGGPAALGGGDTGLGRRREARPLSIRATAPCHRCHNTVARPQETAQPFLPVAPCGCCHLILGAICESNPIPLPHPANFPSEFGVVIHKLNLELRKPLQPYLTLIQRVL